MGKIIIMEGPDGCGKTEIGKGLSKVLGIPYFKMTTEVQNWRKGKFKEALEFDQTYLLQFLKQTGHSAIIDRAYPSEWVYSQVYNRETNEDIMQMIDYGFSKLDTHIVIPWREDYSNNRHDDLVTNDKLQAIHDKYFEFMKWTGCDKIPINVDRYKNDLGRELDYLVPILTGAYHVDGQI